MKKLIEKIKAFFKRLFGKKEVAVENTTATATVSTEIEVAVVDEEPKPKVFSNFSEDDKENLLNIVRPLIKGFNSDEFYINACNALAESKMLKTFATMSEDNMTLTIKLTQNKLFNENIADFIADHVVSVFKSSIDAEFFGKFEVESDGGAIIIRKVD